MEQSIGKIIERETDVVETSGETGKDVAEFATSGRFVRSNQLIIRPTDLFVESNVGRAAQAAPVRVLVKNAADEERIISDMRAQQERLFWRHTRQRNEHV